MFTALNMQTFIADYIMISHLNMLQLSDIHIPSLKKNNEKLSYFKCFNF